MGLIDVSFQWEAAGKSERWISNKDGGKRLWQKYDQQVAEKLSTSIDEASGVLLGSSDKQFPYRAHKCINDVG